MWSRVAATSSTLGHDGLRARIRCGARRRSLSSDRRAAVAAFDSCRRTSGRRADEVPVAARYSITVLTSVASGQGPIEGAERVVRTADALASPLNWRRRHFEALGGGSGAVYATPSRLESVVVPDLALAGWVPFALSRALRLTRGQRFDCVLTSSPPQSAHLLGLALRRRGVPWIAELRDGWTSSLRVRRGRRRFSAGSTRSSSGTPWGRPMPSSA